MVDYRLRVEYWLRSYPERHLGDFLGRFRSDEPNQHESAYFELYLHERLRTLAPKIRIEEPVPGTTKTIDFLLEFGSASKVGIEALHIAKDSPDPRLERTNHWVREVKSTDFALCFGLLKSKPRENPNKQRVQSWARSALNKYTWEEATSQMNQTEEVMLPVPPLVVGSWQIEAKVCPKVAESRSETSCLLCPAGGTHVGFHKVPQLVQKKIENKIHDKFPSDPEFPLVIAANVGKSMLNVGEEELKVLYGFEHRYDILTWTVEYGGTQGYSEGMFSADRGRGIWSTPTNQATSTRCSGIWFFHQAGMVHPEGKRQALYLNPHGNHPEELAFLRDLSTAGVGSLA